MIKFMLLGLMWDRELFTMSYHITNAEVSLIFSYLITKTVIHNSDNGLGI